MGMKNAINHKAIEVKCRSFRAIVTTDYKYTPYPKTKEYVLVTLILGSEVYSGTAICMPEDVEKFSPRQLMQIGVNMALDRALDAYINARIVNALPFPKMNTLIMVLQSRKNRKRQLKKEFWAEFNEKVMI